MGNFLIQLFNVTLGLCEDHTLVLFRSLKVFGVFQVFNEMKNFVGMLSKKPDR